MVTGRNSVLEALRAKIPATAFYIAQRVEMDDRVKEMLSIATHREIPVMEVTRPELDRMAGFDGVHQGVALKVPPYEYAHPQDLLESVIDKGQTPLFVALDGITDPRNLGAIIRSTGAFGGHGVILPQRRSASVNSAAWKTSAGAAARIPVAIAPNLTSTLKDFKKQGVFVLGLDGGGDVSLPALELADRPVVIVVGLRGQGPVAPGHRDVRSDRLDPDRRGHRVAERRDRGIRRPLPGLDAAGRKRLTSSGSCAGMNTAHVPCYRRPRRKEHHGTHRRHRRNRLRRPQHRRRGGEPRPHGRLRRPVGPRRARRGRDLHRGHAARCARPRRRAARASTSSSRPSPARGDMVGSVRPGVAELVAALPRDVRIGVIGGAGGSLVAAGGPRLVDQDSFTEEYKPEALEAIGILEDLQATDTVARLVLRPPRRRLRRLEPGRAHRRPTATAATCS